jgi:hypothetical protein
MDERDSRDGASLSEEAPWRGPWGGGELLHWGPWNICSDSLWIQASLSLGAPTELRGTSCLEGRLVYYGL